ncbi:MAG TPA: histidine phosphatase family protein [Solirubrobacterales bacterium]|nr:histidine phosphatase family protein [Solirubrobacterales bacterium]
MRLLFLRHAESVSNADPEAVGLPEAEGDRLTKRGHRQALAVARALRESGATRLLVSPMGRAQETAKPIAKALDLEIETHPGIHELREADDFLELPPEEQKLKRWSERMAESAADPDSAPEGAESFNDVLGRVRSFKADLENSEPEAVVLAISHGIFGRFFLIDSLIGELFRASEVGRLWQLRTANCGLSVFEHGERRHPADPEMEGWVCASWMQVCWRE